MTDTVKGWLFGILAWFILDAVGVIVNFDYFMYSEGPGGPWFHFIVSVLFVIYMVFFAWNTTAKIAFSLGGIYLVIGIIGYFVAKYSLIADWMIVPTIVFATPFAGLEHLLRSDTLCWLVITGVGAVLITAAVIRFRKEN